MALSAPILRGNHTNAVDGQLISNNESDVSGWTLSPSLPWIRLSQLPWLRKVLRRNCQGALLPHSEESRTNLFHSALDCRRAPLLGSHHPLRSQICAHEQPACHRIARYSPTLTVVLLPSRRAGRCRRSGSLHRESCESGRGRIRNPLCGEDS